MSCIVLVGGGIGCGKTTLINYLLENKTGLFGFEFYDTADTTYNKEICPNNLRSRFLVLQFDKLCTIEEQKNLMKTLRGWRDFRADLLIAAERFISLTCGAENGVAGPLTERSHKLFKKICSLNSFCNNIFSNAIILVEDNFYYRSMRYDWLQIARRTNLGFATIFVNCPLSTAVYRNSSRNYQIPEERIKKMLSCVEFPDSIKFKWEKFSVMFDSSSELAISDLTSVVSVIKDAMKNPAEQVICEEKIEAQKICAKNVIHQADKILRRIVSKKISSLKDVCSDDDDLKLIVSTLINIRQRLLCDIKQGAVNLSPDLVETIQNLGVDSVLDVYEENLNELFSETLEKEILKLNIKLDNLRIEE